MSTRVAQREMGPARPIGRFLGGLLAMALALVPFALIGFGLFALVSTQNHPELDPAIAPAYSTAVAAMEDLPGVACPQETQYRFSQVCAWGGWRLELVMGTTSMRQVCKARDQHAIFGGTDWVLQLLPIPGGDSASALSPDEDAQLGEAFGLGDGVNRLAC